MASCCRYKKPLNYMVILECISPKADPSTPSAEFAAIRQFPFRGVGMTRKENLQKQFVTIFLSDIPTNPYSSLYIKRIRLATALRSLRTTKLITVNLKINGHEIMISTQLPSPKYICYSANHEIGLSNP